MQVQCPEPSRFRVPPFSLHTSNATGLIPYIYQVISIKCIEPTGASVEGVVEAIGS